jgi:hypothetical protein
MRSSHALATSLITLGAATIGCASGSETTTPTSTWSTTTSHGGNGGAGGSTGGGGSGATGGQAPNGCTAGPDHVVISEVVTAPAGGEFVEIWNRGTTAVALDSYYLSDNATYYGIANGQPFAPTLATAQTDFLARFPAGATLAPGAVLVVQAASGDFSATYPGVCPSYVLSAAAVACGSGTVPPMATPTNGAIGTGIGTLLSNEREMLVLFCWDGTSSTVRDVDYVTWGTVFDAETRSDKSAVTGYQADTAAASQTPALAPAPTQSIARCTANEPDEATSGGNGISGHNETSENLGAAFTIDCTPTPGDSACAGQGGCGGSGA